MKWIRITKTEANRQVYQLLVNNHLAGEMSYQLAQQSVRILTPEEQRVFFISRRRPRRSSVVIETEYGFREALISLNESTRMEDSGTIVFRETTTEFTLRYHQPGTELIIYGPDRMKPRAVCQFLMDAESNFTPLHINWRFRDTSAALIWGVFWYLAKAEMARESMPAEMLEQQGT